MTPERRKNLLRMLAPRHVAFIGGRDAEIAIGEAKRIGFRGDIWPLNPRREMMGGYPCFASVEDLPVAPDAVFLAAPRDAAIETAARLSKRGAGGIVCYSAGFREVGVEGAEAERRLVTALGDMALIGPNCYGVINYLDRVALWPFAHGGNTPGYGAAIITQSGMLSSDITMTQRSLPVTHMISAGNQAVFRIEDFVDLLCENPAVRAIGLHIEGLTDIGRFEAAALKALKHDTPIVALKTGSSDIGRSLTVGHTGSLSGKDDLYDALFERVGVVRVQSPTQLMETLKFLAVAGAPKSDRVVGFTCSGAGATMLADRAATSGIRFAPFEGPQAAELRRLLPPVAHVTNPLDYGTPIWGMPERTGPVFRRALSAGCDASVLVQDFPAAGLDDSKPFYRADADAFVDAAREAGIPAAICSTFPENLDRETRDHLVAQGVAPMQGLHEALDAIAAGAHWSSLRNRIAKEHPSPLVPGLRQGRVRTIDEAAGKEILRRAGFPVPEGRVGGSAEAAALADALGYPVALKLNQEGLAHKSDIGAVVLNLDSAGAVEEAARNILRSVRSAAPDSARDSFLVERMQPSPVVELLVGLRRDAQFGDVMTVGSGGVLVELIEDTATVLLPATAEMIRERLIRLKIAKLLTGYRGRPGTDLAMLVQVLEHLAGYFSGATEIAEIEINPLFVFEDSVCTVDVLISVCDESQTL